MPVVVESWQAVRNELLAAGDKVTGGVWLPNDTGFLDARARDLVGLERKAKTTANEDKRIAYRAAARDVIHHVALMATIRLEGTSTCTIELLIRFFEMVLLPALAKLLPVLLGEIA